ncbi:MAG: hypothetical protein ACI9GM_000169 [Salibacteraceae bacterium]|jgi:hypothetical protein
MMVGKPTKYYYRDTLRGNFSWISKAKPLKK